MSFGGYSFGVGAKAEEKPSLYTGLIYLDGFGMILADPTYNVASVAYVAVGKYKITPESPLSGNAMVFAQASNSDWNAVSTYDGAEGVVNVRVKDNSGNFVDADVVIAILAFGGN